MSVRRGRAAAAALASLLPLAAVTACRDAPLALGPDPAEAARRADALLGALALRMGPVDHEPAARRAQARLARAALAPSRVFRDPSLWTSSTDERTLSLAGTPGTGRVRLALRPAAPPPVRPGESRAVYRLRRLGASEYGWRVSDELALGPLTADDLGRALATVLTSAAHLGGAEVRERVRRELPRTTALAARLYRLDVLEIEPAPDGSAALTIGLRLDPAGVQAEFPRYAAFLRKYAVPLRADFTCSDATGAPWWQARTREGRTDLRLRIHGGSLAPLAGPLRPLPDELRLGGELSMKAGLFRIGLRDLEAELTLDRGPDSRGFVARFRRAPDWRLPFLVEPLLRSPLRRPFEGEGSWASWTVRSGQGVPAVLAYEYGVAVEESWIVRWLGGLFGSAVAEYRSGAEEEADRFQGALLAALREDVRALLADV